MSRKAMVVCAAVALVASAAFTTEASAQRIRAGVWHGGGWAGGWGGWNGRYVGWGRPAVGVGLAAATLGFGLASAAAYNSYNSYNPYYGNSYAYAPAYNNRYYSNYYDDSPYTSASYPADVRSYGYAYRNSYVPRPSYYQTVGSNNGYGTTYNSYAMGANTGQCYRARVPTANGYRMRTVCP